jgi:hypothetical protein
VISVRVLWRRFCRYGLRSEAGLGYTIASDKVALQHERDVLCAGFADCYLRFAARAP